MRILSICIILFLNGGLFAQQETNGISNTMNHNNSSNNIELTVEPTSIEELNFEQDSTASVVKPYKIQSGKEKKGKVDRKDAKRLEMREVAPVPAEMQLSEELMDFESKDEIESPKLDSGISTLSAGATSLDPAMHSEVMSMEGYSSSVSTFTISEERSNTQRMQRSPSMEQQIQMDATVNYFELNAPSSFEHNYFKYTAGNYDVSLFENLELAEVARPNNSDVHVQMAGYYMINEEADSALVYIDKLRSSERLTDNVIDYAEDVLRSVPDEGLLITHGFDDSYGVYYAQQMNEIRPDVRLVSLDFMQSEHYRNTLEEEGYKLPESGVINVDYLAEFCTLNVDKNLSISLTTPKEYFKPLQSKLFVVGLVFEYHEDKYDNFYKNDYLWNEEFTKKVIYNPVDEKGKQLSANYLPMLLHLRKVYDQRGEKEKQKEVDDVSDKVGVQSKKYEQVQKVKASY